MPEKCREYRLSLNPAKCVFGVASGNLLGDIMSKEGIVVDPDKVKVILEGPAPNNTKALSRFLGQIWWHRETRGNGLPGTKSNVVTSPGGSTSRLDEEFPCVRRCVGYSNREHPDATHRAEMVPTGVLRKPEAIKSGMELLHDGEGSPRYGI